MSVRRPALGGSACSTPRPGLWTGPKQQPSPWRVGVGMSGDGPTNVTCRGGSTHEGNAEAQGDWGVRAEGAFTAQTATEAVAWDKEEQLGVRVEAGAGQAGPMMDGSVQML